MTLYCHWIINTGRDTRIIWLWVIVLTSIRCLLRGVRINHHCCWQEESDCSFTATNIELLNYTVHMGVSSRANLESVFGLFQKPSLFSACHRPRILRNIGFWQATWIGWISIHRGNMLSKTKERNSECCCWNSSSVHSVELSVKNNFI